MSAYEDRHRSEAVGWLISAVPACRIAALSHQARAEGCPEVADILMRWADYATWSPARVAFEDRQRHREDLLRQLRDELMGAS